MSDAWSNVAAFVPKFAVFLLILIVGYLIGIGMGELVLRASGRFRGRTTAAIAIAGCIWAYAFPYLLTLGVDVGGTAQRVTGGTWVVIGAVIACYIAYQRTQ